MQDLANPSFIWFPRIGFSDHTRPERPVIVAVGVAAAGSFGGSAGFSRPLALRSRAALHLPRNAKLAHQLTQSTQSRGKTTEQRSESSRAVEQQSGWCVDAGCPGERTEKVGRIRTFARPVAVRATLRSQCVPSATERQRTTNNLRETSERENKKK